MAKRKIVWSRNAEVQLERIFNYFIKRNRSEIYSKKLFLEFSRHLETAAQKPEIGLRTRKEDTRGLIVGNYILFYEIFNDKISVLKVWDCRQNPDKLNIPK